MLGTDENTINQLTRTTRRGLSKKTKPIWGEKWGGQFLLTGNLKTF